MSDSISRADAICEVLVNDGIDNIVDRIKALPSAEPKGDLISREEARKAFAKINDLRTLSLGKVGEVLDSLPSADAEFADMPDIPRYYYEKVVGNMAHEINMLKEQLESADAEWIPVSERLPDVDVEVLTTTDWSDVLIAWLLKGGAWETEEYILANDEILAWMPLPKPYKGGDDE